MIHLAHEQHTGALRAQVFDGRDKAGGPKARRRSARGHSIDFAAAREIVERCRRFGLLNQQQRLRWKRGELDRFEDRAGCAQRVERRVP